jgi:hypothetical protein
MLKGQLEYAFKLLCQSTHQYVSEARESANRGIRKGGAVRAAPFGGGYVRSRAEEEGHDQRVRETDFNPIDDTYNQLSNRYTRYHSEDPSGSPIKAGLGDRAEIPSSNPER